MNLNFLFLLSIIMLQATIGTMEKTYSKAPVHVIVSPDLQNDTRNAKEEVDDLRKAINGDDKIILATALQLNATSIVRQKIEDALLKKFYANGTPVPGNINVELHAKKEDGDLGSLNIASAKKEQKTGERNIKADKILALSKLKNGRLPPIFLNRHRLPTDATEATAFDTFLALPLWRALRPNFTTDYFARKKV